MGMIGDVFAMLFGNNRNVLAETVEVFRENSEKAGVRDANAQTEVLRQFAAEFAGQRKGGFDVVIDGLNRLPRPLMAFGTLGLIGAAMVDPVWFAARMQGLALVPEPLWWLMGAIVSFYFGARHQLKGQEFQRAIAQSLSQTDRISRTTGPRAGAAPQPLAPFTTENAALQEWQAQNGS